MAPDIPDALVRYLAARDRQRQEDMNRAFTALTPREQTLVREAAVMGYVQGVRSTNVFQAEIPPDAVILATVVDACLAFRDQFPTIAGHQPDTDDEEAPSGEG